MKTIYKSIILGKAVLAVSLSLQAEVSNGSDVTTSDIDASALDGLRVELGEPNVSGVRDLIKSGAAVVSGSTISVTLGGFEELATLEQVTYRLTVKTRYGTQVRTLYALDITVPRGTLAGGTQEYEDSFAVVSTFGDGGGEFPDDYARQGDDPNATNTAIYEAMQGLTGLEPDVAAGKIALASAITAKGVQSSADETLQQMAVDVQQITQSPITIDGGEMYAKQLYGAADPATSPLWNLYDVLAEMKSQYLRNGNYSALIVCEYYKGYDSLQLQGADAYYTCDGAFYDYDALHVWTDTNNNRANRWVCFLYRQEGARLDITNTAISPRSMYIGGHIGTIEYFTNGRLTDLICGVEETDAVDNFLSKSYTQDWGRSVILNNIRNIKQNGSIGLDAPAQLTGVLILNGLAESIASDDYLVRFNAGTVSWCSLNGVKHVTQSGANKQTVYAYRSPVTEIHMPDLESCVLSEWSLLTLQECTSIRLLDCRSLVSINNTFVAMTSSGLDLIDIIVGGMTTNLKIPTWNPTNILADADKTAQLIDNIKNHILARVSDATGGAQLVFTISTNMYNAIASKNITWHDQTMTLADAFLTKNWLLAGA